ncbi:MAG: phosphotransferase [Paracoccaceae bacterium]
MAAAIGALQSLPLTDLPEHDAGRKRRSCAPGSDARPRSFPILPKRSARPSSAWWQTLRRLSPCRLFAHRDLHEKQIVLTGGLAGILDFDTLSLGDPALDIGNLQAHLFLAGLHTDRSSAAFEWALMIAMPGLSVGRVRIWRRAALLRLAMIYAFSDTAPHIVKRLVGEAGS